MLTILLHNRFVDIFIAIIFKKLFSKLKNYQLVLQLIGSYSKNLLRNEARLRTFGKKLGRMVNFCDERINDIVAESDQSRGSFVLKPEFHCPDRIVLNDNLKCFPFESKPSLNLQYMPGVS